jgi:hypothetical protein
MIMPTIYHWRGWKFHFYSSDLAEPPHIHVRKDNREVKLWLADFSVAKNRRCTEFEINEIVAEARRHREAFLESLNEHFGD